MDTIYILECALQSARREGTDLLVYLIEMALAEALRLHESQREEDAQNHGEHHQHYEMGRDAQSRPHLIVMRWAAWKRRAPSFDATR